MTRDRGDVWIACLEDELPGVSDCAENARDK